ncbi:MAG: hypothetical protein ASARMPRED_006634 [Alectoria sarmentosa]|nr:MAG: hypothetical protein ASARMPRED_006634 [Alectoria sarmentosa]
MSPIKPQESPKPLKPTNPADVWLPKKAILKIMSNALPADASISEEATEMMEKCALGFIQTLTHEGIKSTPSAENASKEKTRRKVIYLGHILPVMESNGFKNHAEALRAYMKGYWDQQQNYENGLRENMHHGVAIPEPEDEDMGNAAVQDQQAQQYCPSSGPAMEPPDWPCRFPSQW